MKNIKLISLIFIVAASFFLSSAVNAQADTAKYVYDANNCLTEVIYSNGRTINFTYDNNGNLTNVTATGGTLGPTINTQPTYHPVETGESITLSITATGAGALTYKWYKDGVELANGGDISGADTSSLTVSNLDGNDRGSYYCIITDSANGLTATSNNIMVYVLESGITDFWTSTTYLAPGSRFSIYNFEVPTITASFTSKPKLLKGELVQPVAGKTVTYALTLLTAPTVLAPKETLECVWPTAVLLYDKTKLTTCYTSGFYCADFLALYPQYDKDTYIAIQTATGNPQYLSRFFTLTAPEITAVTPASAIKGSTLVVDGNYFGKKAPIAWLEFKVTGKPGVSKLLLKVLTPLSYPDEKNVAGTSCMDLDSSTGVSKIQVLIPATLPADLIKGDNNIVIDNGQGLATFTFSLQ